MLPGHACHPASQIGNHGICQYKHDTLIYFMFMFVFCVITNRYFIKKIQEMYDTLSHATLPHIKRFF